MIHRTIFAMLIAGAAVLATACDKPQEEDCKRAVANIRNLYGTASAPHGVPPQAAVRSCRGSADKESVRCIIAAKSMTDLEACAGSEFLDALKGEAKQPQQQAPAAQPAQPQQQAPAAQPAQPQQAPAAQPQQAPAAQPAQPPAGQGAE